MSIAQNISPLLMCLFSYIFLGEILKSYIKETIVLAFVGCSVIVYGNYIQEQNSLLSQHARSAPILAWVAIVLNSNSSAASSIIMRKIKTVHWITMNIYLNLVLVAIFTSIICYQNVPIVETIRGLDSTSWFLINIISWSEISNVGLRLMALRYQNPGALAPYVYVYTLYGLAYDLLIFHVTYIGIIWLGIGLVLSAFIYHVCMMISDLNTIEYTHESDVSSDYSTTPDRGYEIRRR